VRYNWVPLLSAVLGPEWRDTYGSELAAMVALQTTVRPVPPPAQAAAPASPPAQAVASPPAAGKCPPGRLPPPPAAASPPQAADGGGGAARAFTVEAVDVDGKRRRLRRKRAASPEEYDDVTAAAVAAAAAANGGAAPPPVGAPGKPHAAAGAAPPAKAALVQGVTGQVARLSLDSDPGGTSPLPAAAAAAAGGGARPRPAPPPAANGAGSAAGDAGAHQGLADSLALVHSLSRRLYNQHSMGTGAGAAAAAGDGDGASAAPGFAQAVAGTLRSVLGGVTADRCDLLGRTALHVAAAAGRADVAAALVAAGCDVNKRLPLDYRAVLTYGVGAEGGGAPAAADPTDAGAQAAASRKRGRPCAGEHAPAPAPPSLQCCTALHLAAAGGDVATLEALLAAPAADLGARSIDGATPLHFAALAGHAHAVARLARAPGADLDAADRRGRTALHLAAALGHSAVVDQLWARGARVDPADSFGWRPLHYAARGGHAAVAASLVIAGSQVQACDGDVSFSRVFAAARLRVPAFVGGRRSGAPAAAWSRVQFFMFLLLPTLHFSRLGLLPSSPVSTGTHCGPPGCRAGPRGDPGQAADGGLRP
jgi:ankyrin repeat protein